ncbi:MAG TPA: hypothetical protein VEK82_12560, partial [Stellaceae bacterium]|nr:hypothetical protein [Stellaceae bacterium]
SHDLRHRSGQTPVQRGYVMGVTARPGDHHLAQIGRTRQRAGMRRQDAVDAVEQDVPSFFAI